jgi:hypothetical protein
MPFLIFGGTFFLGLLCGAMLGFARGILALAALMVVGAFAAIAMFPEERDGVLLVATMGAGFFLVIGGAGLVLGGLIHSANKKTEAKQASEN